ncbi:MAG: transcription factor, partial [Nanoarchaeota archaeon]|nr:transcription factor [Nanoarchaeota archaeon]
NFFICSQACVRLDFEQATEFEFKCPECGILLHQQDNVRTIDHIKERIKELETLDSKKVSKKNK